VTDHTADNCTADRSDRTAAGKNRAADGPDAGADGRILFLRRHAGTTRQTKQHGDGSGTDYKTLYRFHGITSFKDIELRMLRVCSSADYDLPKRAFA
jgi:hypothetical protein